MKAVVFVDVQNDFVKGGVLGYRYPEEPNHQKIIEFAKKCRAKGYQLFATVDSHMPTKYEIVGVKQPLCGYHTTYEGKFIPVPHCIDGTNGHQIIDGLVKDENRDVIIPQGHILDKSTFGALNLLCRMRCCIDDLHEPLEEIIICGYCTSICVVSNALLLRANFYNIPITVVGELCGDIDKESHEAALKVMHNCLIFNKSADAALGIPQDAS